MSAGRQPQPPALTLDEFYRMPSGTRLEVYVSGTGMWAPAKVHHGDRCSSVTPVDDDLVACHEVVIGDDLPDVHKTLKLRLVRRPHPPGRRIEDGLYRQFLEKTALGMIDLIRTNTSTLGVRSCTHNMVLNSARRLMTEGGFVGDLWLVLKEVVHDAFAPAADGSDDLLMAILSDIERDQKKL